MDQNLQSCFQQFQIKRNQNFLYKQYVNKVCYPPYIPQNNINKQSKDWQDHLRQLFILQAKKYLGVPYHERYHDQTSPHFNAPLYLDCSGLVRQVIYDLREQFGFTLGKWNQAYQYDLLDEAIPADQMQEGDLIFYSGTFYNKNERVFQHNIVHVEIYLGSGEKSIGARYQNGTVTEFDSYKFESKRYYDVKYLCKSIKPWLEGNYGSFCKEHPWRDDRNVWVSEKYSVFTKQQQLDGVIEENQQKKKVYVGQGNNADLIKRYFLNKPEYELMDTLQDAFKTNFYFKWVQCPQSINYYEFRASEQIINHIPKASHNLGLKIPMLNLLREQHCQDMLPKTYRLDQITEVIEFLKDEEQGIWIIKPYNQNCGKGIQLINDIRQFKIDLNTRKQFQIGDYYKVYIEEERNQLKQEILRNLEKLNSNQQNKENQQEQQQEQLNTENNLKYEEINPMSIIQKYIEKPLLLENRKFDIRCYALIANVKPYIVLFHEGYARLSIFDYTLNGIENEENKVIHLTNAAVQKQHPKYKENKESTIWVMAKLESYLEQQFSKEQIRCLKDDIKNQSQRIFKGAEKIITKSGQQGEFEFFGLDFIIDESLKVNFLEANINPALFTDNPNLKEIIPKVIHSGLDIILDIQNKRQFQLGSWEQIV